jgi:hypothetical protein
MTDPSSGAHLQSTAERAEEYRFFMASAFKSFCSHHSLNLESLASFLGCSLEQALSLALCRRPTSDSTSFRDDLESLAAYSSVHANKLLEILREVEAIEAFGDTTSTSSAAKLDQGFLMAARDRRRTRADRANKNGPRTDS